MKIREALKIIEAEGRTIPCDMYEGHEFWSESRKEYREFLDMDIIHVFRIAIKHGMSREPSYTEYKKGIYTLTVK